MAIIEERIRQLALPDLDCAPLTKPQLDGLLSTVKPLVAGQVSGPASHEFSIADLTSEAAVAKLAALGVDEETVLVCWPAFREGFKVRWRVLLAHFADLWHPISDDVVVTSSSASWALHVTHEETVRFFPNKARC